MPRYDESIIHQHAQSLYDRADSLVWRSAIAGAIGGGLIGKAVAWAATYGIHVHVPTVWLVGGGALLVAISAAVRADQEVFELRLTAQTALCQAMIQRNTAEAVKRLGVLVARSGAPRA